ncbi:MAG: hypothetical protein PHV97_07410, partial [Candidatus Omnitrophica bacterium]|nr:hypothetical protein [Candidatus Omnitrophota bacterium]
MKNFSEENGIEKKLIDRVYWLNRLRWVAILGVVATIVIASQFFRIALEMGPLGCVAALLAMHNGVSAWLMPFLQSRKMYRAIKALANLQIFLDLTCL